MASRVCAVDAVCTMATAECADELALFLTSLRQWHPKVPVFIAASSQLLRAADAQRERLLHPFLADANISFIPSLDQYGPICRSTMETAKGVWYRQSRHTDFMMEKANIIDHALHVGRTNALFADCDVTFLAPLPVQPTSAVVGLSAHGIRGLDERLFGRYNGGYVYVADPAVTFLWRSFAHSSRYFDQAALEDVARAVVSEQGAAALHEFPRQVNYGYWRMFQSDASVKDEVERFGVDKTGLTYLSEPLRSVHTHFAMPSGSRTVPVFNRLVVRWLQQLPVTHQGRQLADLIGRSRET